MKTPGKVLCIIPAKGGSTRLYKKNIKLFMGKPLLAYTIQDALESRIMTDIVVSTEDKEIKLIAEYYGAEVPYLRPEKLAKDPAGVVDVCLHMIEFLEGQRRFYDTLIILLPTSPLRSAQDVIDSYDHYLKHDANFMMTVAKYDHTPFSALKIEEDGYLKPFFEEYIQTNSHPSAYRANGAVTIVDIAAFKKERAYYSYPLQSYIMPPFRSIDIDTEMDFIFAEFLVKEKIVMLEKFNLSKDESNGNSYSR